MVAGASNLCVMNGLLSDGRHSGSRDVIRIDVRSLQLELSDINTILIWHYLRYDMAHMASIPNVGVHCGMIQSDPIIGWC